MMRIQKYYTRFIQSHNHTFTDTSSSPLTLKLDWKSKANFSSVTVWSPPFLSVARLTLFSCCKHVNSHTSMVWAPPTNHKIKLAAYVMTCLLVLHVLNTAKQNVTNLFHQLISTNFFTIQDFAYTIISTVKYRNTLNTKINSIIYY